MQNFIQEGRALNMVAPAGGVVSGQSVLIGSVFGVAGESAPAGSLFVLWTQGVFSVAKTNAQAWNAGDRLYWDNVNLVVTNVQSGSLVPVGFAVPVSGPVPGSVPSSVVAANPSSTGTMKIAQASY